MLHLEDSEENNPDENEYSAETYTVNDHEALSNKIKESILNFIHIELNFKFLWTMLLESR